MKNQTYSRIIEVFVSEDADWINATWVVLETSRFSTLHFIVLADLFPSDEEGGGDLLFSAARLGKSSDKNSLLLIDDEQKVANSHMKHYLKTAPPKVIATDIE